MNRCSKIIVRDSNAMLNLKAHLWVLTVFALSMGVQTTTSVVVMILN